MTVLSTPVTLTPRTSGQKAVVRVGNDAKQVLFPRPVTLGQRVAVSFGIGKPVMGIVLKIVDQ